MDGMRADVAQALQPYSANDLLALVFLILCGLFLLAYRRTAETYFKGLSAGMLLACAAWGTTRLQSPGHPYVDWAWFWAQPLFAGALLLISLSLVSYLPLQDKARRVLKWWIVLPVAVYLGGTTMLLMLDVKVLRLWAVVVQLPAIIAPAVVAMYCERKEPGMGHFFIGASVLSLPLITLGVALSGSTTLVLRFWTGIPTVVVTVTMLTVSLLRDRRRLVDEIERRRKAEADALEANTMLERKVAELKAAAKQALADIDAAGGAVVAIEQGLMKRALVESNARRIAGIESGRQVVVGVNRWGDSEQSPLTAGEGTVMTVPEQVETDAVLRIRDWRAKRDAQQVAQALSDLEQAARSDSNIMDASIQCAKVGVTTGEWGETLRQVFGRYRAPTGVSLDTRTDPAADDVRMVVADLAELLGATPRMVVGKPGLDGHSNGAEQIALRGRDVGFDVTYEGIRLTPEEIVAQALATKAHVVGLSILSGSHVPLVRDVMARMRNAGLADIPVVVGGIIPPDDENVLRNIGVAAIYTPKDYAMDAIMKDIVRIVKKSVS
jgi:methylmalonyl-CoA mutase cobalamin-binding domain/chain